MDYGPLKDYRSEERSFMLGYTVVVAVTIIFCTISRAPSLIGKGSPLGLELNVNVGYVVIYGPLIIWALVTWEEWIAGHLHEHRIHLPEDSRRLAKANRWRWPALVVFLFPGIGIAFLAENFVQTMASAKVGCNAYNHLRTLYDFAVWETQAVYCFGVDPEK